MNPPGGVTWDRALSPKSGLCTDRVPRHSEPGAQTPLVPMHLPYFGLFSSTTIFPFFFTLFFAFFLFCLSALAATVAIHV